MEETKGYKSWYYPHFEAEITHTCHEYRGKSFFGMKR